MTNSYLHRLVRQVSPSAPAVRRVSVRRRPSLEVLDDRTLPSAVPGLHLVSSPAVNHLVLNATAAIAPNDVWAVGSAPSPSASENVPIAEHFNGTSWSVVPTAALPSGTTGELFGVTAVASNNVWAVGMLSGGTTQLIEHWDGAKWSVAAAPSVSGSGWLNAVTAISANDVWAVGFSAGSDLIEHFNGTSWSVVPGPGLSCTDLFGVSGTASNDVWAVGVIGRGGNVHVLHWNGTAWSVVAAPSAYGDTLQSVTALVPNNVWAVGSTGSSTLIEHWDGTQWSIVPSPNVNGGRLVSVAAVSANNIWVVGSFYDASTGVVETLTEHFDGTSWTIIPSPNATSYANRLTGVTALSTGDVVAVGNAFDANGNSTTLILSNN